MNLTARFGHPAFRLLAAFAVLQALFWAVFHPIFVDPPRTPVDFVATQSFQYAELEGGDREALAKGQFAEYQPAPTMREPGYHAARAQFSLDAIPADGLAILSVSNGDNILHFVNGEHVAGRGSMELGNLSYRGNIRGIRHIPAGALKEGENTITTLVALETPRELPVAPPTLAPYNEAISAFSWFEFLQTDLHLITGVATLVLGLLIGAVAINASDRRLAASLFVLVASWGIYALIPIWVNMPVTGVARVWIFYASYLLVYAAWPIFVDQWSGKPLRWFSLLMGIVFGAAIFVGAVLAATNPDYFAATFTHHAMNAASIISIAATSLRLAWHFAKHQREERIWEGAFMLLLLFFGAWHLFDLVVTDLNNYMLTRVQPFILLAIAIGFFAGRFHLFKSAGEINRVLQDRLDLREAELAEAHLREKVLVREQAFGEERKRIMRDMHDGLGSQLMGMLLAARRGKAEPDSVAEGLQQVIDELRLMIDSMDSVGDSLGTALAGLRNRLQPRIEDAGFAFAWDNRLGDGLPSYPPRKTLQLFRIMQEAVANALKHSGGQQISISLDHAEEDDGTWLEVGIADDGQGIQPKRRGGHGLDNMRARAVKEGGRIELSDGSDKTGGLVRVLLPLTEVDAVGVGEGADKNAFEID